MAAPIALGSSSKVGLMLSPAQHSAMPFDFDLTAVASYTKDLFQEQSLELIDFVQSIWIDNSANANALTIAFAGTPFSITVKAHTQGFYPVIAPEGKVTFALTSTVAAVSVHITLLSMAVPYVSWATQ